MSHVITNRARLSRRVFLKGVTFSGAPISIGLPPLAMMFNANGTAFAAEPAAIKKDAPIESRFVVWFNGNGIPERYWIPAETGRAADDQDGWSIHLVTPHPSASRAPLGGGRSMPPPSRERRPNRP